MERNEDTAVPALVQSNYFTASGAFSVLANVTATIAYEDQMGVLSEQERITSSPISRLDGQKSNMKQGRGHRTVAAAVVSPAMKDLGDSGLGGFSKTLPIDANLHLSGENNLATGRGVAQIDRAVDVGITFKSPSYSQRHDYKAAVETTESPSKNILFHTSLKSSNHRHNFSSTSTPNISNATNGNANYDKEGCKSVPNEAKESTGCPSMRCDKAPGPAFDEQNYTSDVSFVGPKYQFEGVDLPSTIAFGKHGPLSLLRARRSQAIHGAHAFPQSSPHFKEGSNGLISVSRDSCSQWSLPPLVVRSDRFVKDEALLIDREDTRLDKRVEEALSHPSGRLRLYLNNVGCTSLEHKIDRLRGLRELHCQDNPRLTRLPHTLWHLGESLTIIHASRCGLESVPEELCQLKNLKRLSLAGNRLKTFVWDCGPWIMIKKVRYPLCVEEKVPQLSSTQQGGAHRVWLTTSGITPSSKRPNVNPHSLGSTHVTAFERYLFPARCGALGSRAGSPNATRALQYRAEQYGLLPSEGKGVGGQGMIVSDKRSLIVQALAHAKQVASDFAGSDGEHRPPEAIDHSLTETSLAKPAASPLSITALMDTVTPAWEVRARDISPATEEENRRRKGRGDNDDDDENARSVYSPSLFISSPSQIANARQTSGGGGGLGVEERHHSLTQNRVSANGRASTSYLSDVGGDGEYAEEMLGSVNHPFSWISPTEGKSKGSSAAITARHQGLFAGRTATRSQPHLRLEHGSGSAAGGMSDAEHAARARAIDRIVGRVSGKSRRIPARYVAFTTDEHTREGDMADYLHKALPMDQITVTEMIAPNKRPYSYQCTPTHLTEDAEERHQRRFPSKQDGVDDGAMAFSPSQTRPKVGERGKGFASKSVAARASSGSATKRGMFAGVANSADIARAADPTAPAEPSFAADPNISLPAYCLSADEPFTTLEFLDLSDNEIVHLSPTAIQLVRILLKKEAWQKKHHCHSATIDPTFMLMPNNSLLPATSSVFGVATVAPHLSQSVRLTTAGTVDISRTFLRRFLPEHIDKCIMCGSEASVEGLSVYVHFVELTLPTAAIANSLRAKEIEGIGGIDAPSSNALQGRRNERDVYSQSNPRQQSADGGQHSARFRLGNTEGRAKGALPTTTINKTISSTNLSATREGESASGLAYEYAPVRVPCFYPCCSDSACHIALHNQLGLGIDPGFRALEV